MSVPVPKRGEGELDVNTKGRALCVYTLRITANQKAFPTDQVSLTEMIRADAISIYTDCWTANNIRVDGNAGRYAERMRLQEQAANKCNHLYAMIELAKPLFHLSSKRCRYWIGQVVELRGKIRAWHDRDATRLKPNG